MSGIKHCSECSSRNNSSNNYCVVCGHKLKKVTGKENKKYCTCCGERLDMDMDYCGKCGRKIKTDGKGGICSVCGEKYNLENGNYCWNCGHDIIHRRMLSIAHREGNLFKIIFSKASEKDMVETIRSKKCPNCNHLHQKFFSYCEYCGTKLVKK